MRATVESPLGRIMIVERDGALIKLEFTDAGATIPPTPLLLQACRELEEYFAGERRQFSLPLAPEGTAFQKDVWRMLAQIPYGETRTYAQLAADMGKEKACRAVGGANGKNPLPILIPCHRVVAAKGKMGGYSLGLWRKEWLLLHEHAKKE
ncbi:MAG: methylated-DNA--[protein]-cysteine S-methyltransferase [Clostridiales bacterium]|nr:methylated-DNA--[protein]-cysteine S-methyltransferase [Clostridiales bacterium]